MLLNNRYTTRSELIIFGIMLTASFDIVGAVTVGGMTLRFAQLLIVFACVFSIKQGVLIDLSTSSVFLIIWMALQFAACFTCSDYKYSFGYFFWTLLNVSIIVVINGFVKTKEQADNLLRLYIYSFVAVSILGLIQFILGFAGINFFLTQPTLNGTRIPRLNGFTYEPSYYATYLLPGWVMAMYLAEKGSGILSRKKAIMFAAIITAALFLSTSRMGWIFMAIWVAFRGAVSLWKIVRGSLKRTNLLYLVVLVMGILAVIVIAIKVIADNGSAFLIDGLGIGGESDHSSSPRITAMKDTLELYKYSPLIGYSLGGLPVKFSEYYNTKMDTGATMCVWAELFVASGILGTTAFVAWIASVIHGLRNNIEEESDRGNECKSLFYAFLFEIGILALNQNILRIYIWVIIGVMMSVASKYRSERIR